jgi:hypothetical protein
MQFAIRTNIRNHKTLSRVGIIRQVAEKVGPRHPVDLANFDLLILVEVYKVSVFSIVSLELDGTLVASLIT